MTHLGGLRAFKLARSSSRLLLRALPLPVGRGKPRGLCRLSGHSCLGPFLTTEEWIAVREGPFLRIFPLLVIPFALSIAATIALIIWHPSAVPRLLLVAILSLQAVRAISTLTVQVPIQFHLNHGFDLAATNRLIVTDFWLRKIPLHLEAALVVCALWLVVTRL